MKPTAGHLDAALLALCAEFRSAQERYDGERGAADPDDDLVRAAALEHLNSLSDQIAETPAKTLPGIAARLRHAYITSDSWIESRNGPGERTSERDRLLWAIMEDAERLARHLGAT